MLYQNTNSTEMRSSHLRLYDIQIPNLDAADGEVGVLTLGSMIFYYRTWMPLAVKWGNSNLTLIGRLPFPPWAPPILPQNPPVIPPTCSSSPLTDGRPSSACISKSLPARRAQIQRTRRFSSRYIRSHHAAVDHFPKRCWRH